MPRHNFTELDRSILGAIQEGKRDFTSIAYDADIEALANMHASRIGEAFRVVDRRLQALRKKGEIEYRAKEWHISPNTSRSPHD